MDLPENRLKDLMPDHEKAKWMTINNHNITEFKEADIRRITKDYTESIGKGAFGEVYKGILDDGSIVAVKKYKDQSFKRGFAKEVTVHCQINHKNVVRLLGYCAEDNALTMVTEFIPRGSLEQLLHGCDDHLSLAERLCIATECAEALSCMHAMYQPVIHGDIKPANILLDGNFGAKVSDFGISRLLSIDKAQYTVNVVGSRGYVDPEFLLKGFIDPRNDVYSFGVVLLELMTRKKVWENGVTTNLVEDFNQAIQKGKQAVRQMFDAEITNASNMKVIEKIGKLAADCMKGDLKKRPEMKYVVQRLYMLTEAYHQGEEETGLFGTWGTKRSSQESTVTPKSDSKLLNKMGSWDIFNRNARINFVRNAGPLLEKINHTRIFTKQDLKGIINDRNIVGRGNFGLVFKGIIDNKLVAVKMSNTSVSETEEFANWIVIHSMLIHRNIIRLIGCCLELDVPILIYDFASKGSLHDILHGTTMSLDIDFRLNIAEGSAEALAYIHSSISSPIVHGDVTSRNILLDDNFVPKISDFGVPRMITGQLDYYMRDDCRRYGDPECMNTGHLTTKNDIFGFGLVLMELITRKVACFDFVVMFRDFNNMQQMAPELDTEIVKPRNLEALECLVVLVQECLNIDVNERPTMAGVAWRLQMIKKSLKI